MLKSLLRYVFLLNLQFACCFGHSFELLDPHYNNNKITVIDFILNHKKSYITYIMDGAKNVFLVKQGKHHSSFSHKRLLMVVREMLNAYIAELHDIPANRVRIIPAGYAIPGKLYVETPATLHTLVPGKPLNKLSGINKPFIQQPWEEKFSREQWGLTYRVIHDMSLHPSDLPLIVALDTFIGNAARRHDNFFYDKESDKFWAIDLESSFDKNLCKPAYNCIHTLLKDKVKLTSQELNGLIIYRDTLKKLIKHHPPDELYKKMDEFMLQAGIKPGSLLFDDEVVAKLLFYKKTISENYKSAQELVLLLDELIAFHRTKIGDQSLIHPKQEKFNLSDAEKSHDYPMRPNVMNLDCSKEKAEYIIDRMQAYQGAFSNYLIPVTR